MTDRVSLHDIDPVSPMLKNASRVYLRTALAQSVKQLATA
jgi:hypothetical protein